MEILVILALVVSVILIVGYPLVHPLKYQEQPASGSSRPGESELYGKREVVFEALRDLQFEFATGKLSSGDYEQLKGAYEVQAAQIMQQIDSQSPGKHASAQRARVCPRCAATTTTHDKFCTHCGAKL
jgi:hypothetical protein